MIRLFFVGIKHSGKTTFASRTAMQLGMEFRDADDLIKDTFQIADIREFYRKEGKEAFMEKEYQAMSLFLEKADGSFIVSLGGGASDNSRLLELLKANGKIIYLKRDEKDMLPVILRHGVPAFLDASDIEGSFHRLYEKRDRIYSAAADLTVELGPYRDKESAEKLILRSLTEAGYGC